MNTGYTPIWAMIKDAIESLGGKITHKQIKQFIWNKYGEILDVSISCAIRQCTVNCNSRINYDPNKSPRIANAEKDFLFSVGPREVVKYEPREHGIWGVRKDEFGNLAVCQLTPDLQAVVEQQIRQSSSVETNLRDYLISNLHSFGVYGQNLKIFSGDTGRDGLLFRTDNDLIDILAQDECDNFVVFSYKRHPNESMMLQKLLDNMSWVKSNLSNGSDVFGVLVVRDASQKLKREISQLPTLQLYQFTIQFSLDHLA